MHPQVDVQEFRERLSRARKFSEQYRERLKEEASATPQDVPLDVGDESVADVEQSTPTSLESRTWEHIELIDDALFRLDEGSYGECVECGSLIDIERLRAAPETAYCVACAASRAHAREHRQDTRL